MTAKEQQAIDNLLSVANKLREENAAFRQDVSSQIDAIKNSVNEKHLPLTLETDVHNAINNAIAKGLSDALSNSYNSPLVKYAQNVVAKYQQPIEQIFDDVVKDGIQTAEFKSRVRDVLLSKIAKTMISGVDGSIDKTINLMKQDQVFRSRLTLAVNGLVDEFLISNK